MFQHLLQIPLLSGLKEDRTMLLSNFYKQFVVACHFGWTISRNMALHRNILGKVANYRSYERGQESQGVLTPHLRTTVLKNYWEGIY